MNFNIEKIKEILFAEYGFEVGSVKRLGGFYDGNFKLMVNDTPYFIKIYAFDKLPAILFQIEFIEALKTAGVPVANIVSTKEDKKYFPYEGTYGILQEHLEGEHFFDVPFNEELTVDVGRTLAKTHQVTQSTEIKGDAWKEYPWDMSQFDLVEKHFDQAVPYLDARTQTYLKQLFIEWNKRKQDLETRLPKGIIHNDFHGYNLFVKENQCTGVIDFGDALHSWYAADIGISLAHLCFHDVEHASENAKALLKGYTELLPLDSVIAEDLLLLMQLRIATVLVEMAINFEGNLEGIYLKFWNDMHAGIDFLSNETNKGALLTALKI